MVLLNHVVTINFPRRKGFSLFTIWIQFLVKRFIVKEQVLNGPEGMRDDISVKSGFW